jgi:hypothetical protein
MARKSNPKASPKASFSSSRRGGFTAVDLGVSTLAGLSLGFALFAMPSDLFSSLVLKSGLPSLVAAAQPPLGATARLAAAGAGALGAFVAVALILRWLGRAAAPAAPRANDVETLAPDAPRVRRADAHPDAPPRRPIFAGRDFGEEEPGVLTMEPVAETVAFEPVDEEPRRAPPAPAAPPAPRAGVPFPPSDEPFYDPFLDLYRRPAAPEPPVQHAPPIGPPVAPPAVADWPMPAPAAAAPPPPPPAPRPEPVAAPAPVAVQPPPPAPRPEPIPAAAPAPAPAAAKAADSIADLLGRLDQGLARRGAPPPLPPAATAPEAGGSASANRLREALGDLQRIAGRG